MNSISVFFPCYNDEYSIGKLVEDADEILKKLTKDYEIIVIDDGSRDGSRKILKQLKTKYQKLKTVHHKSNRGYGGALISGFKKATKDLIFYTDGDGQYDVKELPLLHLAMSPDVSFVNGIKMDRQDYSYRVVLGNMYAFIVRWLFLLKVHDVDCDFRLIRKDIVKKMRLKCVSGAVCVEMVKRAEIVGAKFRHVGVHHYPRLHGQSQFFKLPRLLKTLKEEIRLWVDLMILKK
jgi:glycosyltransferase involved in cell wall biosynthesis